MRRPRSYHPPMPKTEAPPKLSKADEVHAYDAAQKVVETHRRISKFLRTGMTLAQIDAEVARVLEEIGCRSCFLGYKVHRMPAFPSHACLSVNECIVHGTGGYYKKPMKAGDILKIDVGVWFNGWVGDAAWTYAFETASPLAKKLMDSGKESLRRGITKLRPGGRWVDWAQEVEGCVEGEYGFKLIAGLGGHGYGKKLHDAPYVSNIVPGPDNEWREAYDIIEPGTLVAVEPMIAVGSRVKREFHKQWPIMTMDGSLAVHYEADVLVTPDGPRDLTEGMTGLPDIVG